jgi:hypothetical protein
MRRAARKRNNCAMSVDGTAQRILQEVASSAHGWKDVHDILHRHSDFYFAMEPRDRERLNEQIKDLMRERMP